MKIYNNIDGQARLAENFADGINSDDLATVGQSSTPVFYTASQNSASTFATQSAIGQFTDYVTRANLVQGQYASGCTANTNGTNLVNLPSGVFLVNFSITFYVTSINNIYLYTLAMRIDSSVGFADGVNTYPSLFRSNGAGGSATTELTDLISLSQQRIVNVSSSAILGFTAYCTRNINTTATTSVQVYNSNYSVSKL